MKSLIVLSHKLLQDLGKQCGVSTIRDEKTLTDRIEHEGISFITITLPSFGKAFEKALEDGHVADDAFAGFGRHAGLPRFLGGFLQLVFDRASGALLEKPSLVAIRALRQFCLAFGKVSLPCSDVRNRDAIKAFLECEKELTSFVLDPGLAQDFQRIATSVFSPIFSVLSAELEDGTLLPKHGPGATADGLKGNLKFTQPEWTTRLEAYFPYGEYAIPSWSYYQEIEGVKFLEPGDERPVKVTLVPKTLKTPRIIAVEPTCMQYAQQAVLQSLVPLLEADKALSGMIGFRDQLPNQELARFGSSSGELATLDLSEASDRVSNQLAILLFGTHDTLRDAVQACRSSSADVPGHGVIPLAKFASMGSALCFPVEAMVFFTIICLAWEREQGHQITRQELKLLRGRVRVYGDDLIVPVEIARAVILLLESFGLKVNKSKSFLNGKFRESCGGDFYDGEWVTPIRVREPIPTDSRNAHAVASTVALRNRLFEAGFDSAVEFLDRSLKSLRLGLPQLPVGHSALGLWTWDVVTASHFDSSLQAPMVKAPTLKSTAPMLSIDGHHALMKFFLKKGARPLSLESFKRSGRPEVVLTKPRKVLLELRAAVA